MELLHSVKKKTPFDKVQLDWTSSEAHGDDGASIIKKIYSIFDTNSVLKHL
jgi:hypothetical protein